MTFETSSLLSPSIETGKPIQKSGRRDWQIEAGSLIKLHLKKKTGQEQPKHIMKIQMKNSFYVKVVKKVVIN